ncbi:MAG: VCBS domain-containing protein [Rubrivivax sp.]
MSGTTGTSGSDNLNGGSGDDAIFGGAGDDKISGGSGSDTLDGGSGSDSVNGGSGDDVLIYRLAENAGSTDTYTGGSGWDVIRIMLTSAEWLTNPVVQAELTRYYTHLETVKRNANTGEVSNGGASDFTFNFGGGTTLKVQMTEELQIYVDGSMVELDKPFVDGGIFTGGVKEDTTFSAAGTITFVDLDVTDTHTVAVNPLAGAIGTLSATVTNAAFGDGQGVVGWTYSLNNAAAQYLAAGETKTEVFTVVITDDDGKSATQQVTVTITGTNDVPVANAAVAAVDEDAMISGSVSATDADAGETATLTYALVDAAPTGLTFMANGSYSFDASSYDYLKAGEPLVLTIPFTASDATSTSAAANLVITITGTNDVPVFTSGTTIGTVREHLINASFNGWTSNIVGSIGANDADSTGLIYSIVSDSSGGAFEVEATTGQITVRDVSLLDYEVGDAPNPVPGVLSTDAGGRYYSLQVQVSDGFTTAQQAAKIYITNVTNAATSNQIDFVDGDGNNNTFSLSGGNDVGFGDNGNDNINGGNADDLLFGGNGNDSLSGNNGGDILYGGAGSDTLAGGNQADTFVFGHGWDNGVDNITDFDRSEGDKLHLVNDYAGLFDSLSSGGLTDGQLLNGSPASETASTRVIYDANTGNLYYDADGAGGAAAVHFATFATGSSRPAGLLESDFVIGVAPGP